MTSEEHVQEIISNFMCSKDRNIENFLKERAIEVEIIRKDENDQLVQLIRMIV